MKIYYTYHLIDPETNRVFYVGKGHGNRMKVHQIRALKWQKDGCANKVVNRHLYNKILKIINNGLSIIYFKIFESENESEVLKREIEEIKKIGLGNLCNLTEGGEGGEQDSEVIKKIRDNIVRYWASEAGQKKKLEFSMARTGSKNPRWGIKEDDAAKKIRMANMLSVPRWNKGLKGDPRAKGFVKGTKAHNAIPCRLINIDGRVFEAESIVKLSEISDVPLITISRLKKSQSNNDGWKFEII